MIRKSIRKKIIEVIKAANIPGIGNDVFPNRSWPTNHDTIPVCNVYDKTEQADRFDEAPKSYAKTAEIVIEVITQADNDGILSDELNDFVDAIEMAIEDSVELEQMFEDIELRSVNYATEPDGGAPAGSAIITYAFSYIKTARTERCLPDFNQMKTTYQVNGQDVADAASDQINLNEGE